MSQPSATNIYTIVIGHVFALAFFLTSLLRILDGTPWNPHKKSFVSCFLGFALLLMFLLWIEYLQEKEKMHEIETKHLRFISVGFIGSVLIVVVTLGLIKRN